MRKNKRNRQYLKMLKISLFVRQICQGYHMTGFTGPRRGPADTILNMGGGGGCGTFLPSLPKSANFHRFFAKSASRRKKRQASW
jgi:hypothetical protein